MSRGLAELLTEPPRGGLLPQLILDRAAALAAAALDRGAAEDPAAVRADRRRRIAWCLGLDRIPRVRPQWQRLGELAGDGYSVERGIYTAVPGLPVPAHLYLPSTPGAHPAVVHTPGHWMENARLEPDVQRLNAWLARAGLIVLCYDPIGQGERRRGWHQHGQLAPLLAGFTTLGVMVCETLAALDVLAARPDVDPVRLGLTGASGGGFVSTFAAALDERVASACMGCILNTHVGQLRGAAFGTGWDGWVDLCNQVPRLAAVANVGAVVGAIAPRDVTVVHAIDDPPFPVEGAREVVREAAAEFTRAGAADRIRLIEVSGGHGLHAATRAAAVAALARSLGLPPPPAETEPALLEVAWPVTHDVARSYRPQSTARAAGRLPGECFAEDLDTNPVLVRLARDVAAGLRSGRRPSTADVEATLGTPPAMHTVRATVTNHVELADGGSAQRLRIDVAPGVMLDAVLQLPEHWGDDVAGVLVVIDEGGKAVALDGPAGVVARAHGWAVLAPDLRGTGESAAGEFELATAAWLLDRDLLGDRVADLRAVVRFLSERYSTGEQIDKGRIAVYGAEAFGLVALLAAALDPAIAAAASGPFVTSLEELLVESPRVTPMAFPFRALEAWDIDDLVRLAAPRPVLVGAAADDAMALVERLLNAVAA